MILVGDFIPQNHTVLLPEEFRHRTVLANLEGPICADGLYRTNKVGVCLHSMLDGRSVESIGTFAFSLANNHLMDFREEGLLQTQKALMESGIPFAGAGLCETDARRPMILKEGGKRIAVFCCCERQFGIATESTAGCAEKGVWLYNAIREIKHSGSADYVIVSCHAASEFSPWVSPSLHDFYHSLIDAGADCIHGHHAHVPQGYEEYKRRPIFYGLGNFVVDAKMWADNPNYLWSLVAEVEFEDEVQWHVRPYAVKSESKSRTVMVEKIADETLCAAYLQAANYQFSSRSSLVGCWQEACVRLYYALYEQLLRASSVETRRLSVHDVLRKMMFVSKDLLNIVTFTEYPTSRSVYYAKVLYNYFNCPSHANTIATALGVLTGVEQDLRMPYIRELAEKMGMKS